MCHLWNICSWWCESISGEHDSCSWPRPAHGVPHTPLTCPFSVWACSCDWFLQDGLTREDKTATVCDLWEWTSRERTSMELPNAMAWRIVLLVCIRFLYKVVHKNGRLRKFNRARQIEFNFFIIWTIFMKLGTLVHHVHGYKTWPQIF